MNIKLVFIISAFFAFSKSLALNSNRILEEDTTSNVMNCSVTDSTIECSSADNETLASDWNANNITDLITCVDDPISTVTSDYDYNNLFLDCGQSGIISVIYTITDDSGNATTLNATLSIVDTTSPIWDILPSDQNVNCDTDFQVAYENWLDSFSGTDTCGSVSLIHDAPATISCGDTVLVNFELYDDCGNTTTNSALFNVEDTFSVSEFEDIKIEMFPNPTENAIRFKGLIDNSSIEIFDILGKSVYQNEIINTKAIVLNLKSGHYVVKISSGHKSENKKLIIK